VGNKHTGWKRRWFVLEGKMLTYYKTEKTQEESGHIGASEMVSIGPAEDGVARDPPTTFCFIADTTFGRRFCFCAEQKEDMDLWMESIQHQIDKYNEGKKAS
jgi:hypothetical protein